MKYIKFTDWQELGLKKDVEEICRNTKAEKPLIITTCWELIVSIISIVVSLNISDERDKSIVLIITIIIIIAIPVTVVLSNLIHWCKDVYRSSKGMLNVSDKINSFDNKVCSWTMMSTSYVDMLKSCYQKIGEDQKLFLYQEINYYINKSIVEIYSTLPVVGKVYSGDPEIIANSKRISLSRLYNIIKILETSRPRIESDNKTYFKIQIGDIDKPNYLDVPLSYSLQNKEIICFQEQINEFHKKNLEDFKNTVNIRFNSVSALF